jgi:hypothetical protein
MWNAHLFGLCLLLVTLQACQRPVFEPVFCDEGQAVDPATGAAFDFGVRQMCGLVER